VRAAAASLALAAVIALAPRAAASIVTVPATGTAASLALARAAPGDTLVLARGVHRGPLRITTRVVLRGAPGAVVEGPGAGSVIGVAASGTTIEDLTVRGSGRDVMHVDAAVQVLECGGVTLRRLEIRDVLYGIYGARATGLAVEDCDLAGRVAPLDESGEGNGIHLWYTSDARIHGNRVEHFLDAIFLSFANGAQVDHNRLQWNGRYGLHTMYCQANRLEDNVFTLNVAGCALMFSNGLRIARNDFVHNRGSRTYGLLLRDCSAGEFLENRFADNTIAVFMDDSNRNRFAGNLIQDNGWGILLFSSCAGNEFAGNNFIQNDYPVALDMRRTHNRFDDGASGNYWSENAAYDLDNDGVSDVPYCPVSAFAFVSKQYPDLTILAKSPAVAALGVAERVFPAMVPSEAVDRFPRVSPVPGLTGASAIEALPAARPSWIPLAAFAGLGALGALGFGSAVRARGD